MNWEKALTTAWQDILKKNYHPNTEITHFEKRIRVMVRQLDNQRYHFGKWKAILINKKDGGKRPILKPILLSDKIVLKAIAEYISMQLKLEFNRVSDYSFAYQKGKNVRDALLTMKDRYSQGKIIIKLDIKKFFNNIDKDFVCEILTEKLPDSKYLIELVKESLNPQIDFTEIGSSSLTEFDRNGLPQGNPVSSVLSNLYLYDFDMKMKNEGHMMIRYADDMVFLVNTIDEAYNLTETIAEYLTSTRNLELHPLSAEAGAKSSIFDNLKKRKLTFLGATFNGEKLLPTKECIHALSNKVKSICRKNTPHNQKITSIRTSIAQWCGYYAFTDISDKKLASISLRLSNEMQRTGILAKVDLVKKMRTTRQRQRNKGIYSIFPKQKFGSDYHWLQIYP